MSHEAEQDAPTELYPPRVLLVGVVGAVLLWLAQPPAGFWPLAWVAPAFWLWLANHPAAYQRREYFQFWLAAALYWALTLHWVCLPHPLTPLGLPFLASYLALYHLGTFALVRAARRRWHVPLWIAAPVAWTGMELLQARLFTGFLMGAVSHSQAGQPWLRSIAAWVGAYGVTFVVVMVAATVAMAFRGWQRLPTTGDTLGVAAAVLMVIGLGGAARWGIAIESPTDPSPTVALIQGDTRATWDPDPKRSDRIMERQTALTSEAYERAAAAGQSLDLIVWPESMFRLPVFTFGRGFEFPADINLATRRSIDATTDRLRTLAIDHGQTPLLVGVDHYDWPTNAGAETTAGIFNGVAVTDEAGELTAIYDKTHLVPFGEYIPLAKGIPALYYLTPMPGGLNAGDGPVAMSVPLRDGGVLRLSPSICYESVVPRVIRRQVKELIDQGERPDALVNVTNDAWFWGASELDMHLACDVYRAVENGTPLLVAANGGLSAVVDATGEVRQVSPRMQEHVLIGEVPPKSAKPTPYTRWGDWFAGLCLLACGVVVFGPTVKRLSERCSAAYRL